jgi:hypothetical protein
MKKTTLSSSLKPAQIIGLLSLLLLLLVLSLTTFFMQKQQTELFLNLPDTTTNIHIGLPFDHNTKPAAETSVVDYVFGSQYPENPSKTYHTFYLPYDTDENTQWYKEAHDLTWWKANHSDWIIYQCDKKTVAYSFGNPNIPLDFTNPAVVTYMEQTYITLALKGTLAEFHGHKFDGIAFDDPAFTNNGSWTGQRCGHYDTSGNWVQQFNATADDPAWRQAIITWAKNMQNWFHANYPKNTMSVNFSFDPNFPSDSNRLLSYIDFDFMENGFTNGNGAPANDPNQWYYTDVNWLSVMQGLQSYLAGKHAIDFINQEPVPFAQITKGQVQWALANYLLIKNNASYVYIAGYQEYGPLYIRPEYSTQIGSATGQMYQSQGVYMRDFTNGKAIVNPSSTQTFLITLPAGAYKDCYGKSVPSVTLGIHSAIVLLK